ncbi:type VII secretion protein EssC [Bacillus sp. FSL W7-1360]
MQDGDVLSVGFHSFVIEEGDLLNIEARTSYETNLSTVAKPTSPTKKHYPVYRRTPRMVYEEPEEQVKFSFPTQEIEDNRPSLWITIAPPAVMLLVMILVMTLVPRGIFIIISITMFTTTIIVSIVRHFNGKKQHKKQVEKRERVYKRYMDEKRDELHEMTKKQSHALHYHFPDFEEIKHMTHHLNRRIWEKTSADDDFLHVRVGRSDIPISFKLSEPGGDLSNRDRDDLLERADQLYKAYSHVKNAPLRLNLSRGATGYIGYPHIVQREVAQIVGQLAFAHSYHDLRFVAVLDEEEYDTWAWMRWLPHFQLPGKHARGFIYNEVTRDQLLNSLYEMLRERDLQQEDTGNFSSNRLKQFSPHIIFLVANRSLIGEHAIMEYLEGPDKHLSFSVLFLTEEAENLSEHVHTIVQAVNDNEGEIVLQEKKAKHQPFHFDVQTPETNTTFARTLFALDHKLGMMRSIPDMVSFMQMFDVDKVEDLQIGHRWKNNNSSESMSVPIGYKTKDDLLELNIHEKAHGPHGLLAGTTGSGKSEFLQTYILSLAVNYHPHEVAFLLIDYKGGGMAQPFKNIPHLLGVITNINESQNFTLRALMSIKSELKKRQRLFDQHTVSHINDYMDLYNRKVAYVPMPHLFIISDEFAELKAEEPDFIKELVSTARIGRSLGVHLILATQKPKGVVDGQIWSNSRFKVALKVQDEEDSREILKNNDAASITETGRGYLQIGNNEQYDLFQSAWSGAPYMKEMREGEDDIAIVTDLGLKMISGTQPKKKAEKGTTEIEAVVKEIAATTEKLDITKADSPWIDPLEDHILQPEYKLEDGHIRVPIALADDPERQQQYPVYYEWMQDTNVAVFGSGGYGKSMSVMTLMLSLAQVVSPRELHYYIFDFGNGSLLPFMQLAHTGDYTKMDDDQKIAKMMDFIEEEIDRRRDLFFKNEMSNIRMYNEMAEEPLPAIYVVLDNYDLVKEEFEPLDARFVQIARDGQAHGVFLIFTATQVSGVVKSSLRNNMPMKIVHYMVNESDMQTILDQTKFEIEPVPGRVMIKRKATEFAQMYLPIEGKTETELWAAVKAKVAAINKQYKKEDRPQGMAMLPAELTLEDFRTTWAKLQDGQIPVGLDEITVKPIYTHEYCMVVGSPGTGKTNTLKVLLSYAQEMEELEEIVLCDNPQFTLKKFITHDNVRLIATEEETLAWLEDFFAEFKAREQLYKEALSNGGALPTFKPILVVIDDLPKMSRNITGDLDKHSNSETANALAEIVKSGRHLGLRLLVAGTSGEFAAGNEFTSELKMTRHGVVLVNPTDQTVFKGLKNDREALKPGMGYYVNGTERTRMKIPEHV